MTGRVVFLKSDEHQINDLPLRDPDLIVARPEAYAAAPADMRHDVVKRVGRVGEFRLRVGDWRAVSVFDDDELTVKSVMHRREIYR